MSPDSADDCSPKQMSLLIGSFFLSAHFMGSHILRSFLEKAILSFRPHPNLRRTHRSLPEQRSGFLPGSIDFCSNEKHHSFKVFDSCFYHLLQSRLSLLSLAIRRVQYNGMLDKLIKARPVEMHVPISPCSSAGRFRTQHHHFCSLLYRIWRW